MPELQLYIVPMKRKTEIQRETCNKSVKIFLTFKIN